jgi:hypothetical protein
VGGVGWWVLVSGGGGGGGGFPSSFGALATPHPPSGRNHRPNTILPHAGSSTIEHLPIPRLPSRPSILGLFSAYSLPIHSYPPRRLAMNVRPEDSASSKAESVEAKVPNGELTDEQKAAIATADDAATAAAAKR